MLSSQPAEKSSVNCLPWRYLQTVTCLLLMTLHKVWHEAAGAAGLLCHALSLQSNRYQSLPQQCKLLPACSYAVMAVEASLSMGITKLTEFDGHTVIAMLLHKRPDLLSG